MPAAGGASSLGNPAPLGLLCFGMTTLTLMYVEMGWAEIDFEMQIAALALALGGIGQVLVAIFEIIKGSSFSFAVFFCYGAFWIAWALSYLHKQHLNANSDGELLYNHPTGSALYLAQWGILTFCFWIITLRKNILLVGVFTLLWMTFFTLSAATATKNETAKIVGGYLGFFTAVGAFYTGVAELINEEYGRHVLPGLRPLYSPERLILTPAVVESLIIYDRKTNTALLQFRGLQIRTHEDVLAIERGVKNVIKSHGVTKDKAGHTIFKVHVVADYNDTLIADEVAVEYWEMATRLEKKYYLSVTRFAVSSFGTASHNNVAEQRQAMLNQIQSMQSMQTMSRMATPAASVLSDDEDMLSDSDLDATVPTGSNTNMAPLSF